MLLGLSYIIHVSFLHDKGFEPSQGTMNTVFLPVATLTPVPTRLIEDRGIDSREKRRVGGSEVVSAAAGRSFIGGGG